MGILWEKVETEWLRDDTLCKQHVKWWSINMHVPGMQHDCIEMYLIFSL